MRTANAAFRYEYGFCRPSRFGGRRRKVFKRRNSVFARPQFIHTRAAMDKLALKRTLGGAVDNNYRCRNVA